MESQPTPCRLGIDIGSTTAKMALLSGDPDALTPLFTAYRRHNAEITETLLEILEDVRPFVGEASFHLSITGSAGMGLAERLYIPFVQEVVATAEAAQRLYPMARMVCDIGGEDSKLILFDDARRPDYRMNGACAGGTGAYIDQMATLLDCSVPELALLAHRHTRIYPIASRCGVFAKTDIQNLLSQGVSHADIAASLLQSVALQVVNTLMRAASPTPYLLMTGGPLAFIPYLRQALIRALGLREKEAIVPEHMALLPAIGTALTENGDEALPLDVLIQRIRDDAPLATLAPGAEKPLFADPEAFVQWSKTRFTKVRKIELAALDRKSCFIGVDSGSTTTKMALVDENGRLALSWYASHLGDHVSAVAKGLRYFHEQILAAGVQPDIRATAATGYGEDLVRSAFGFDTGIVETLAHARAAREIAPDVSFALDIGGQDMKAIYLEGNTIRKIEVNEACSSGCGSFLQSFAEVMGTRIVDFADLACASKAPCDLGSRCTVFMNSRIKQALRQNSGVDDISAGLAYSVVRNCLNKVLKIRNFNELGGTIVAQGGTLLNPAVHRAFELVTGKPVVCPDISGLMGAFGCALSARDYHRARAGARGEVRAGARSGKELSSVPGTAHRTYELHNAAFVQETARRQLQCGACTNHCRVDRVSFGERKHFFTGNRCERVFSNSGEKKPRGYNLFAETEKLLFDQPLTPQGPARARIGIPRALNLFENLPFWRTLFVEMGFEITLSAPSTIDLCNSAAGSIMSDSICFPAKLAHGHIKHLIEQHVDHIFYPSVVFDHLAHGARNSYNCPIVSGYPDVIRSAIDPEGQHGIRFHTPAITFKNQRLLKSSLWKALEAFFITRRCYDKAFKSALQAQEAFARQQKDMTDSVIREARDAGRRVVMLLGRPYHLDPLINQGVPEMLADVGVDVLSCNHAPECGRLDDIWFLSQWAYPNRILNACRYAVGLENVEAVLLNSFGCGPDAVLIDELSEILRHSGKVLTTLRVDENSSPGSLRLRLRTLIETRKHQHPACPVSLARRPPAIFGKKDRQRTLLVPHFSPLVSQVLANEFERQGYALEVLPPTDQESERLGLRYVNNEICYPAILLIGDILKALASGRYDPSTIAIGITQTGGQCRASSYLSMLEKALAAAGHGDVPVIALNLAGRNLHEQPGFSLNWLKFVPSAFMSLVVVDALTMLQHRYESMECVPGSAFTLAEQYVKRWIKQNERSPNHVIRMLRHAVAAFETLPVTEKHCPKIAILGEIYVKHGTYANRNLAEWLVQHGAEVHVPPLVNLFLSGLVNTIAETDAGIEKTDWRSFGSKAVLPWISHFLGQVNCELDSLPAHVRFSDPIQLAEGVKDVIGLCNQAGEGWLLPSEIVELGKHGVDNIVCLQPFGCIANQIVAKGVEKRLRQKLPAMNILFLDLDQNTSDANLFNRLHFLLKGASSQVASAKDNNAWLRENFHRLNQIPETVLAESSGCQAANS